MTYLVVLEFDTKEEAQDIADIYEDELRGAYRMPDPDKFCQCNEGKTFTRGTEPTSRSDKATGIMVRSCCGKPAYLSAHWLRNLRENTDPDALIKVHVWTRKWRGQKSGDRRIPRK